MKVQRIKQLGGYIHSPANIQGQSSTRSDRGGLGNTMNSCGITIAGNRGGVLCDICKTVFTAVIAELLADLMLCDARGRGALSIVTDRAVCSSFSHAAGDEMAAQLMTTSTGPRWSKHCCMPSPVGRSSCTTRRRKVCFSQPTRLMPHYGTGVTCSQILDSLDRLVHEYTDSSIAELPSGIMPV